VSSAVLRCFSSKSDSSSYRIVLGCQSDRARTKVVIGIARRLFLKSAAKVNDSPFCWQPTQMRLVTYSDKSRTSIRQIIFVISCTSFLFLFKSVGKVLLSGTIMISVPPLTFLDFFRVVIEHELIDNCRAGFVSFRSTQLHALRGRN